MEYKIGEIICKDADVILNDKGEAVTISVRNTGDRTIQVCSYYHFFECNSALEFDREKAYGMRLDIPAGTGIRFEPGMDREVSLVPYDGKKELYGFDGLVMGKLDDPEVKARALKRGKELY